MAQLTTVLPHVAPGGAPYILSEAEGGPAWHTTTHTAVSGKEKRIANRDVPRHRWNLTFMGTETQLAEVIALHAAAKGSALSFLWTPPGYPEGSYRFEADDLNITFIAGNPEDLTLRIRVALIEVIGE